MTRAKRQRSEPLRICMRLLFDACWSIAGFCGAVFLNHRGEGAWYADIAAWATYLAVFLAVWLGVALDQKLFISRRGETLGAELSRTVTAVLVSLLFTGFILALLMRNGIDRGFLIAFSVCVLAANLSFTLAVRPSVWNIRRRGYNTRHILVVGANDRTARMVDVLRSHEHYGYRIEGFLEDEPQRRSALDGHGIPFLGEIRELENILNSRVIDGVYISLPIRSHYETIESIAHLCEGGGVPVRLMADLFPHHLTTFSITRLGDMPLLSLRQPGLLSALRRKQAVAPDAGRSRSRVRSLVAVALLDTLAIVLAYVLAAFLTAPDYPVIPYSLLNNTPYLLVFLIVWYALAVDRGLWTTRPGESLEPYLAAVGKAVGIATIVCVLTMALAIPESLVQDFLVTFCVGALVALPACRVVLRRSLVVLRRRGLFAQRVLIVGVNERTGHLSDALKTFGLTLAGVLDDDPERASSLAASGLTYLGATDVLEQVLAGEPIEQVYVTLPVRSHYETVQKILDACEGRQVVVHLLADLLPLHIATSDTMMVEDIPLLSLSPICEAYGKLLVKRLVDFIGSTLLILAFSPLFLLVGLLIKLDSKGPVFFSQLRVGQNQRQFKMIKFRSMIANAEELRKALEQFNEAEGPVFKIREDPRITRVGKFIRKYSIDELPQLFNVWWGEMSLVGPRPPIVSEVEQYTWHQRRRLSVRPGMTGLWQVSGRSDLPFDKWVELDLSYIDSWSVSWDFLILFKTFSVVVTGRGAS